MTASGFLDICAVTRGLLPEQDRHGYDVTIRRTLNRPLTN